MKISVANPKAVVKEAMWLAWQACGGTTGMGFLQDRDGVTKEDVWKNVLTNGDYAKSHDFPQGRVYGDYVFGRMMKLGFEFDKDSITFRDSAPRADYQSWCHKYPSYQALVEAAQKEIR